MTADGSRSETPRPGGVLRPPATPARALAPPRDKSERLPRRAIVTATEALTETGTILISFQVTDDEDFVFYPGQFVAIDHQHPRLGYRRSPYCLYGASSRDRSFTLLVRVVQQGPVSLFLNDLVPGDTVSFRGPSGKSMVPREPDTHLILLPTGVGLGPCRLLLSDLAANQPDRRVTLYWGLRLEADICLTDELDHLSEALSDFAWEISLSQPSNDWAGLRGRITESVPARLDRLTDKAFYLVSNGTMVSQMSAALREMGVSDTRIHEESFFDHRHKPTPPEVWPIVERFVATDLSSGLAELDAALRRRS